MSAFLRLAPFFTLLLACGSPTADIGAGDPPSAPSSEGGVSPRGGTVHVHLRATGAPVAAADGLSGQTPHDQRVGIRKLTLLASSGDPAPLVVFDRGVNAIEAGLNDGDDTVVASVPAATLVAGRYTVARVAVSHVRYVVAATMHAQGQIVPGAFSNLQILSDESSVDGATFRKGHYAFAFEAGGTVLGRQTGENGPLPETPSSGGITLDTSGPESAYVFPVDVVVDPTIEKDVQIVFELGTHESFRWRDEASAGYRSGVFDVTPTAFEPVMSFGARSFRVSSTP